MFIRKGKPDVIARVVMCDISKLQEHDVLVNCSNSSMSGSFNQKSYWMFAGRKNVDTALHQAAGPQLLEACLSFPEIKTGVRCEIGQSKITNAFGSVNSKYIVHTVGPRYNNNQNFQLTNNLLVSCYFSSLVLADTVGSKSIAFPAISCGVGDLPPHVSATASIQAMNKYYESDGDACRQRRSVTTISFCMIESKTWWAWQKAMKSSNSWEAQS